MQSSIAGQLGVKAERDDAVLLHSHGMAVERRDDLGGAGRLHQRRPDEDTWKRLAVQARDIEGRFEAVDLASPPVALPGDAKNTHALLAGAPVRRLPPRHDTAGHP